MKLSFRSKLIDRTTAGLIVRIDRPIAESARALIIPPWTNPAVLAMSEVAAISTTADPSASSTSRKPSHLQAGELACALLLTALALRHRHTCRGRARDQPALLVEDIRLAEEQRLPHVDHAADGAQQS